MNQVKTLVAIALSLPVLFLSGCKSVPRYSSDYANARASIQGIPLDDAKALEIGTRFTSAFNTLGTPKFVENAGALYADQLFINDTLSQFSSRKKLLEHFHGMNQRVSNVTVSLLNTSYHQDSAYVHWHMVYDFKMFGKTRTMDSFGISEIKVNPNHQIIFQQDFWDPANGLYRSLPYVGGTYSWVLPFKKVAITTVLMLGSFGSWAHAQSLNKCGNGPLMVGQKQVGVASYFAQNCNQPWQGQNIQMDFTYTQNIPEWAFKRAATHLLQRNIKDQKIQAVFNPITDLYRPVKSGDLYQLKYIHATHTLSLYLNQKMQGQLQNPLGPAIF